MTSTTPVVDQPVTRPKRPRRSAARWFRETGWRHVFAVVALVFFTLKSRREEAWLQERFDGYAAYRARTRRLIPWVY